MSMKFVVNHVSDETKKGGIVDRYEPAEFNGKDEEGNDVTVPGLVAYVHWPSHPIPFVHQENHAELAFENVYIPEHDQEDEDEQDEDNQLNEEIVERLGKINPQLLEEIMADIDSEGEEGEEEEEGQGEETEN